MAVALLLGKQATLTTFSAATPQVGEEHRLYLDLGGMQRVPTVSSGVIPSGAWGNIPGGETFIAPVEGRTRGVFVLNGAFSNNVLAPSRQLLLRIEEGHFEEVEGSEREREAFLSLFELPRQEGRSCWKNVAELGIGVNSGSTVLVGSALHDEKIYGTAHIALGDSARYGGTITCDGVHEDLITWKPSLEIDGRRVLHNGAIVCNPNDWCESLPSLSTQATTALQGEFVRRSNKQATVTKDVLRVRISSGIGRFCVYTIPESRRHSIVAKAYSLLRDPSRSEVLDDFRVRCESELGLDSDSVNAALMVLLKHGLIAVGC